MAPGRYREDFKIELQAQRLTIRTEREATKEEKGVPRQYTRKEFSIKGFERSFTLPVHVDEALIKGSYEAGVLTISIPKKEAVQSKQARLIDIL